MGGEGGREEWGLVNTLTRARGRQTVARLAPLEVERSRSSVLSKTIEYIAPLEDYLGPSEEGRAARYSTIGRGGATSRYDDDDDEDDVDDIYILMECISVCVSVTKK